MLNDNTLYLIRGLPGSGKTTFAKTLLSSLKYSNNPMPIARMAEADIFLMEDSEYVWTPERLVEAHRKCKETVEMWMKWDYPGIIVSNTFTREREVKVYTDLAEKYGYAVVSLIVENRHGNKSVHDVPEKTVEAMRNRFSVKL
ncbi:AAA domain-containing protein [Pseudomonas phage EM]|uniref:AAA domain-containing protein n=1 Tax=Pseudomonas phage EM TaxID=2936914 RepID=A0AAE9HFZ8_9CAUD|nr:AAA domain-containing protein [Pseudomonas phage EM]UPW35830.1 AAA domain-containing protein [Pseudomonas phage EM]